MSDTKKANIGMVGLAVMGRNLAQNIADHGFRVVALFDKDPSKIGNHVNDKLVVRPYDDLDKVIREEDVVVGVLAVLRAWPTIWSRQGSRSSSTTPRRCSRCRRR